MIRHILKNGTLLEDISGHKVTDETVIRSLKKIRKEIRHGYSQDKQDCTDRREILL